MKTAKFTFATHQASRYPFPEGISIRAWLTFAERLGRIYSLLPSCNYYFVLILRYCFASPLGLNRLKNLKEVMVQGNNTISALV